MSLKLNEAWQNYSEVILRGQRSEKSEMGRWRNHIAPVVGEISIEELTSFHFLLLKKK